ncbi:MAG: VCBS repeat-containing protein [Planctomycetes bacterium]|nr:VCBS repeat-containing protein [Planctomycetota bacterium]
MIHGTSLLLAALLPAPLLALDKNGVAPQAISLPSGPGSIQGLGESFQPQLNTGAATYSIPLALPKGTAGRTPELRLVYDSGAANGPLGLGWTLDGAASITRNLDAGLPRYVEGPNGIDDDQNGVVDGAQEVDIYSGMDREELVPMPGGSYRAESEATFTRYERRGGGWLALRRDGTRLELGTSVSSRIEEGGRVFSWLVDRIVDTDGNAIELEYSSDPEASAQKYLRRIRWGRPAASFAVVLRYEAGRPDVTSDFRPGFEVRTALRLVRIDVVSQGIPPRPDALTGDLDEDGVPDALVRRWVLEYHDDAPVSLLERVTQLGCDGAAALRPVTLEYTRWTPPQDAAALVVTSAGEPAETLSSPSVELCDMNGDALPDLLSTSASQHRVALNLGMTADGRLEWAPPSPVGSAPSIDIGSPQVHLADETADGLSDLLVKATNTRFLCFENTGKNAWSAVGVPLRNTDTWPIWPFEGSSGAASRSMDIDHNRYNDVLFTSEAGYQLWMLLPGRQYAREVRLAPLLCDGKTFRFDLPGTHIADLNGDRLQDLAWVEAGRVVWFPGRGRGEFGEARVLPLGTSLSSADIEKAGFSDIDGDGLDDLTVVRPESAPGSLLYWLNRFERGLEGPRRLDGLPAAIGGDALRWADMNGSGSTDIVISNSARPAGSRLLFLELVAGGKPFVLSRADNGIGLATQLELETSVEQMVRARREGRAWSSTIQLSIPVVRRIVEDDGLGHLNVRELTYRDPYWDPEKQELRGFRAVELRELGDGTASDRIVRHRFDAGADADCLKGKLLLEEVLDEIGKVFSSSESAWSHRVLAVGNDERAVCFAFAEATDTLLIEGVEAAAAARVERDFDDYGNPTVERNLGVAGAPGDEVTVISEYELRPDVWIMDRTSRKVTLDGAGNRVAEQRLAYDARGHLIRQEAWLDAEDRFVVTLRNRYDELGNLVEAMDANGHRRSLELDGLLHAYNTRETVHLEDRNLSMTAAYDLAFGAITSATDFAGAETTYEYDALGRIVATRYPGGGAETYSYVLQAPVSHTMTRVIEDLDGGTHDSFTFYDGYGRRLAKKVEDGDGRWRVLDAVAYDGRKLLSGRWLSWLSRSNAWEAPAETRPHLTERFDAQGRAVERIHPDGSVERTVHRPLAVDLFDANDTAGGGTPDTQRMDGLGRLVEVTQRIGGAELVTRYEWSAQGDLVRITDAQGNVRTAAYDSLRRKVAMDDPDGGRKSYEYDDVGNLVRTVDADGNVIRYGYDFANRLLTEDHVDPGAAADPVDVRFRYDEPSTDLDFGDGTRENAAFTGGRLAAAFDPSGEEHLSYDPRGNTVWTLKRIRDPRLGVLASFGTRFEHDLMDRLAGVTYPDGDRLRYIYDAASLLERIDGGERGRAIVERLAYSETGQLARVDWGNGVVTELEHDERDRLRSLRVTGQGGAPLLHDAYELDRVSNVTRITDLRPPPAVPRESARRRTAAFTYDDLHRLARMLRTDPDDPGVHRGQIDYAYDAIGNLLSRRTPPPGQPGHVPASGDLVFGGFVYGGGRQGRAGRAPGDPPGPRAVTLAPDGRAYGYDGRGNVTSIGGARLAWDAKSRLLSHDRDGVCARFTYDHGGRRTTELSSGTGQDEVTCWVNQWFEVRPGNAPIKYVFNGESRIARVKGTLDPGAPRVQRLWLAAGWNPVCIAVEASSTTASIFGEETEVRVAQGRSFLPVDPAARPPAGRALLVLAPAPRVVSIRGAYAPPEGKLTLSPGEGYAAWPLLEPLVPPVHLIDPAPLHFFDAPAARWSRSDDSLPFFLNDMRRADAAAAIWVAAPVAVEVDAAAAAAEDVVYYHGDHLGSTVLVTDSYGEVVVERLYAPFGGLLAEERRGTAAADYGFTGKERDEATGLTYFGARYYAAAIGRFLSVDPLYAETQALEPDRLRQLLADPRKLSTYAYAGNNPMTLVDPDGLEFEAAGPRAREFLDMVSRHSGLDLELDEEGRVTLDPDGLMDPTASPTLQNLVLDAIHSDDKLVRITAFGKADHPTFFIDTFRGNVGINPARSVHMLDFREVEAASPTLAKVFLGHVLAEYLHAARPRGLAPIQTDRAEDRAHKHALRVEAQIASELTGRPLGPSGKREVRPGIDVFEGSYGSDLRFQIRFHPGTRSIRSISTSEALRGK